MSLLRKNVDLHNCADKFVGLWLHVLNETTLYLARAKFTSSVGCVLVLPTALAASLKNILLTISLFILFFVGCFEEP